MKYVRMICVVLFCLVLAACTGRDDGNGTTPDPGPEENPLPVLRSLTPTAALVNQSAFTLTVTGSSFVDGARIVFNDQELTTTFVSATELSCQVSRAMTQTAALDSPSAAVQVRVRNPAPGGGDSGALTFFLRKNPAFGADTVISGDYEAFWNGLDRDDGGRLYAWFQDTEYSDSWWNWGYQTGGYVIRSDDGGQTWNTPVKFNLAGAPLWPCIAPGANGEVTAVWTWVDPGMSFKRSTDYGDTWPAGSGIGYFRYTGYSYESKIDCVIGGNGTIHMAGHQFLVMTFCCDAYYLRSTDHGASWEFTPPEDCGYDCRGFGGATPRLALGNGVVYLLSRVASMIPGKNNMKYTFIRRSLDDGVSWEDAQRISDQVSYSLYPKVEIASDGGDRVAGAWAYPEAVGVNTSGDRGVTWMGEKFFAAGVGAVGHLDLDYDALGNLMVVWVEAGIVYFRRSTDNAATWSAPVPVTQTEGCSMPQLAVTPDGSIFVSWLRGNRIHIVEGIPE